MKKVSSFVYRLLAALVIGAMLLGFFPTPKAVPFIPEPETASAHDKWGVGYSEHEWYGTVSYSETFTAQGETYPGVWWRATETVTATFVTPVRGEPTVTFRYEYDQTNEVSPDAYCDVYRYHATGSVSGTVDKSSATFDDLYVYIADDGTYKVGFQGGYSSSTRIDFTRTDTSYYTGTDCNRTEISTQPGAHGFNPISKPGAIVTPRPSSIRDSVTTTVDGQTFTSGNVLFCEHPDVTSCSGTYSWDVHRNPFFVSDAESLGDGDPSQPNQRCSQGSAMDPVSTATGNFWETYTDLSIPGRGPALDLSRTYNSQAAASDGPFGYGWSSTYGMSLERDTEFDIIRIRQENGSTVGFLPTGSGTYAPPSRVRATLLKNGDGGYTFTRGAKETFIFDPTGKLREIRDLNGYKTTLSRDTAGKLTRVTDLAGRYISFAYGSSRITSATDQTGRSARYAYDTAGNLASVTDVGGGVRKFTYDANHRMLTKTDPRGGVVTNHYDAVGRVDWQTDALGRKSTLTYNADGSALFTDPKGNKRLDGYTNGLRTGVTLGYGTAGAATTSFEYDPATLGCTRVTDPNYGTTYKTYDARGNMLSLTDPNNRTTRYTYNALNDITSVTDPKGVKTTLTYDARGNLLSVSRPLTGTTLVQKTSYGHANTAHPGDITSMTDPLGKVSTFTYDAYGNVSSSKDPLANLTTYAYDSLGRMTSEVSPKGNITGGTPASYRTTYTYDTFGRPLTITDPLLRKASFIYDAGGNLVSMTDAKAQITRYTYDLAGQLKVTTNPDATTEKSEYNLDGTLWKQIDGKGAATTYGYNALGRMVSSTDPLLRVTGYTYDAAGNLTHLKDARGRITSYTYDAAGQPKSINHSDGITPAVSMLYDANGQRTSMTDGTGTSTWTYDSLGRLTSHTNGAAALVKYGYDLKGQITGITYPGGMVVNRAYDAAGRMTQVKFPVGGVVQTAAFAYDQNSNLLSQTVPSVPAVKDAYAYSRTNALLSATTTRLSSTPVKLAGFTYTRDASELLASMTGTLNGVTLPQETYTHDKQNRLGAVNTGLYGYDAASNITRLVDGSVLAYNAAGQVTSLTLGTSVTKFGYDLNGNRINKTLPNGTSVAYGYDQANRLTKYGTSATYKYNGDGLRMSKTVSGTTTAFAWDVAQGLPLLLREGTTNYVYGPGGVVLAQISSAGALYYHRDQIGSTRLLTDGAGAVKATYTYDAFGKLRSKTGTVVNPFGYTGQYTDAESGMQYLRARYYDPSTAQFINRDPLVLQTREPYSYASNNPTNMVDPSGQVGFLAAAGIGFAVGAAINAGVYLATTDDFTLRGVGGAIFTGGVTGAVSAGVVAAGAGMGAAAMITTQVGFFAAIGGSVIDGTIRGDNPLEWAGQGLLGGLPRNTGAIIEVALDLAKVDPEQVCSE